MQIIKSLALSLLGTTLFITTPVLANDSSREYSDLKTNLECEFELGSKTKIDIKKTYIYKQTGKDKFMIDNNYFFEGDSIKVSNDILLSAFNSDNNLSSKLISLEITNCF